MNRRAFRQLASFCMLALVIGLCVCVGRQYRRHTLDRALVTAIIRSDVGSVNSLLAEGANPNTRESPDKQETYFQRLMSLLHPASPRVSTSALIVALEQYRSNFARLPQTPLIARALIASGADVNARDSGGDTPLTTLLSWKSNTDPAELLEILVSAGADIEQIGQDKVTPLTDAVMRNYAASVDVLLNHGANPNSQDGQSLGVTPLVAACTDNRADIVRTLLDHGANANPKPSMIGTPLSIAKAGGCRDMVNLLRASGAKE